MSKLKSRKQSVIRGVLSGCSSANQLLPSADQMLIKEVGKTQQKKLKEAEN